MRVLISFAICVSILFSTQGPTFAQTPFDNENLKYLSSLEKYSRAHENYVVARSTYLRFKTLIAKEEAIKATREYLVEVVNVLNIYFNLFKLRIDQAPGASAQDRQRAKSEIDLEINFFNQVGAQINQTNTLEAFPQIATNLNEHYKETKKVIDKQTILLKLYENKSILEGLSNTTDLLDVQVSNAQPDKNIAVLQRGIVEIRQKLKIASDRLSTTINKIVKDNRAYGGQGVVDEVRSTLISAIPVAREIIRELL